MSDHLGSIDVITDRLANVVQEMSFIRDSCRSPYRLTPQAVLFKNCILHFCDAWGQRRNASSWEKLQGSSLTQFDTDITTRGYTGHEMVDGVGIIHMNGRIYDARIARFLQADPIIQEPYMTQSLNRYSYVWNNPLNATDPSGYVIDWIAFAIYAVVTAAVAYVVSDIIATIGINNGWSEGTIQGLSLFATFIAAIATAGLASPGFAVGGLTTAELVGVVAISGVVGGITSSLQGGKFGHGFISGGIGGFLGASGWFQGLSKGIQSLTKIVIGGTLSELTGGKFANGAAFAAASVALGLIAGEIQNSGKKPKGGNDKKKIKLQKDKEEYAKLVERAKKQLTTKPNDGELTKAKHFPKNPKNNKDQGCGSFQCRSSGNKHAGVDSIGKIGDDIKVAGSGHADFGYESGYGNVVNVTHDDGIKTKYAHLSTSRQDTWVRVKAGEVIGKIGVSGNVVPNGDAHLHFEITVDGYHINPSDVFSF